MFRELFKFAVLYETPHSIDCASVGGYPALLEKSETLAPKVIVKRMRCFFVQDQLSGSSGESLGCGTRIVCQVVERERERETILA